ncbi:MAG TPA: hypothetical protein VM450_07335 [Thermomicrobiales bacterium]|nr:hypothetical protein [Thermomicrobiales bacterium]
MSTPIHVNLTPEYPRRERVALMADGDGRNPRVVRFACVNENCSHADCAGGNDVAIPIDDLETLVERIIGFREVVVSLQARTA